MIKPYLTNKNMLVPYYLMFSYAYYQENESLISDAEYDQICNDLITNWNDITHWHKRLINLESLKAGTGYDIVYTNMIKDSAMLLSEKWNK